MIQLINGTADNPTMFTEVWLILGIYCSHHTPLPFPTIDSFPPLFRLIQKEKPSIAARTALSTSTATGDRLKWIIDRVKSLIDVSEREEICSSLSSLAQAYSSYSEFDDDEDDEWLSS